MRHLAFASAIAVVIGFGGSGCGGTDGPPDLNAYFAAQPYANPACNNVDERLAGQREMRLYVNGAVDLPPITLGLARYYHRHGLTFFTTAPPQATTMAYALDTNDTALGLALIAAFPDVDFSDEAAVMSDPVLWPQIVTFVANFMLKPMVDFANTHSQDGGAATNLIVVPEMERPGGEPIGDPGTSLAGLAISPALLAEFARTMPDEAEIWAGVNLPANFTPMMALGSNVLTRAGNIDPQLRDLVVSHEFGHTGALVHSLEPRNLMHQGVAAGLNDCTDSLDDAQLALMRTTYGLGATAASGALLAKRPAAPAAGPSVAAPVVVHARRPARDAGRRSAGDAVIRGAALPRRRGPGRSLAALARSARARLPEKHSRTPRLRRGATSASRARAARCRSPPRSAPRPGS